MPKTRVLAVSFINFTSVRFIDNYKCIEKLFL